MKLYKCRFIIGWIDESDGTCGESTGFNSSNDLVKAADEDGSKNLMSVFEYEAPVEYAWEIGASYAFMENWTAHDSLSIAQFYNPNTKTWVDEVDWE